jgi:hypothetical protein
VHVKRTLIGATVFASLLVAVGMVLLGCGSATPSAQTAPAFSGVTLDGRTLALDQFRGKPLLLVYMTST